jgi:hypothetical protein
MSWCKLPPPGLSNPFSNHSNSDPSGQTTAHPVKPLVGDEGIDGHAQRVGLTQQPQCTALQRHARLRADEAVQCAPARALASHCAHRTCNGTTGSASAHTWLNEAPLELRACGRRCPRLPELYTWHVHTTRTPSHARRNVLRQARTDGHAALHAVLAAGVRDARHAPTASCR